MPVVLRVRGFRIWFYQADLAEPIHVHVGKSGAEAKYWMDPIELANSRGFANHELNRISEILALHRREIMAAWQNEQRKANE